VSAGGTQAWTKTLSAEARPRGMQPPPRNSEEEQRRVAFGDTGVKGASAKPPSLAEGKPSRDRPVSRAMPSRRFHRPVTREGQGESRRAGASPVIATAG